MGARLPPRQLLFLCLLSVLAVAAVLPGDTVVAVAAAAAAHADWSHPRLRLGFCGSLHDRSWPAVVALIRKAFEARQPLVPLPPSAATLEVTWQMVYANSTLDEIVAGYRQLLGDRTQAGAAFRGDLPLQPIDALIGCTYSPVSEKVAPLAGIMQVPMVSYISRSAELSSKLEYPYFLRTCPGSSVFGQVFVAMCQHFEWRRVGFMYEAYSAGASAFNAAIVEANRSRILVEGFSFFYYPDSEDLQLRLDMVVKSAPRTFAITFSSTKVPSMLGLASQIGMEKRLLIMWEFIDVFSQETLDKDLRLQFEGMLGASEAQSGSMQLASVMEDKWKQMSFDELAPLGVPEGWLPGMRKALPGLFGASPFFMNHAQLVDAVTAVMLAFGRLREADVVPHGQALLNELYRVSFNGTSGHVSFTPPIDGQGGDRNSRSFWLYEAKGGAAVRIGSAVPNEVDVVTAPGFPDGSGDPRNYDELLVCESWHVLNTNANGHQDCVPCHLFLGTCISPLVVLMLVAALGILLLLFSYTCAISRRNDSAWRIQRPELQFADPPVLLGEGSSSAVLKAEYRGTAVAVKRALPRSERKPSFLYARSFFRTGSTNDPIAVARKETWLKTHGCNTAFCSHELIMADPEHGHTDYSASSRTDHSGYATDSDEARDEGGSIADRDSNSARSSSESVHSASPACSRWRGRCFHTSQRAQFYREMRALSKLRHPCIITVMGAVCDDAFEPMIVMEFMDYGSLRELLSNKSVLLDELALPMLKDIGQGMRFLHSSVPPIVHCNLKASNVLVDARFRAKVSDFGSLSVPRRRAIGRRGPQGAALWMAPELLLGGRNTRESDVYAFGIVLAEVQNRRDPYYGQDPMEVLEAVKNDDPERLKRPDIPNEAPPELVVLMKECWQSDPKLRPNFEEVDRRLKGMEAAGISTMQLHVRAWRTNDLLHDVFPRRVAEALRDGRKVEPEHHDVVTIFFSDIVGFTHISSTLEPEKVSSMLDRLYSKFDRLSKEMGVFKVETIGDAYMAVANLVEDQIADHARRIVMFAINAIRAANQTAVDLDDLGRGCVNIRVGFHSGPVVANVVGTRNPRYCLFGDTVNTASRMETNSVANSIHCSAQAAHYVRLQAPEVLLEPRGKIPIKGKGEMETFWVHEALAKGSP